MKTGKLGGFEVGLILGPENNVFPVANLLPYLGYGTTLINPPTLKVSMEMKI